MFQKSISQKVTGVARFMVAGVALATIASCSPPPPPPPPGECTKCIDNKPAATPFSTTLNAINHTITLEQANNMVTSFEAQREAMLIPTMRGMDKLPLHETFNLKAIDDLLCQQNAVGFRVYMAMDPQQKVRFVLVGVDGDGKDIVQRVKENPALITAPPADVSILVEEAGQRWP